MDKKYTNTYMNYSTKLKWLGIIDYKSLCFAVTYAICIIKFISLLNVNFEVAIYLFSFLVIPLIVFFMLNIDNETGIDVAKIIIRYLILSKVFVNDYKSINLNSLTVYTKQINN